MGSLGGEHGPSSGIEQGVVFQQADHLLHHVYGCRAIVQKGLAQFKRRGKCGFVGLLLSCRQIFLPKMSRSAMDGQGPCGLRGRRRRRLGAT